MTVAAQSAVLDCLIVGQGIAGTFFAHECDKRGLNFAVIDSGKHNASLTAAGMVNPVVLKRFTPVWQGLSQIQTASKTASELGELLGEKIGYSFDMLRLFHDDNEQQTWLKKATQPALSGLLDSHLYQTPNQAISAPFGVGKVHHCGKIDLKTLLGGYRHYLAKTGRLLTETVDYSQLKVTEDGCQYGEMFAKNVVFCEGYQLTNNPFFSHLPLKGNKGEVLTVRIPGLQLQETVKAGAFLMPLPEQGDDVYLLGATYHWTDKNDIPTDAAKTELLKKLATFLAPEMLAKLQVLDHRAGMRPTVIDRRPLLGQHADYSLLWVFNGLGTRGVMLGAVMAPLLLAAMQYGKPLPAEVDVARFT